MKFKFNRTLAPTLSFAGSLIIASTLITLIILIIAATVTLAANFNAGVSPSTINAGTNDILANFSVQNTDAAQNITQLNITLPSGFVYSGNVKQGVGTFSILNNGEVLSWVNSSGVVYAMSTNYIWFEIDTPQKTGNFEFNVSASDSASALTTNNVSINLADISAPRWSSNTTSPGAVTYYILDGNYTFNITWTDNVNIDSVVFEWNGATNYTNTTTPAVVSHGAGKYSIQFRDLPAINYTYKWYANDTNSTANATASLPCKVLPHANVVDIYLNGQKNQNITVNQGTQVNITVTGQGTLYIYENNNLLSNGVGPLTTMRTLNVGNYSYKANATATANYTQNTTGVEHGVKAIYPPPKYSISTTIPDTWYNEARANWTATWTDDNDPNGFDTAFIELNHTGTATNYTMNRSSTSNVSSYSLLLTTPTTLTWKIYANNSYGSWNATNLTTVTVSKITPDVFLNITPALNVENGTQTTAHCTSPHVTVNLYMDGVSVSTPHIATLATGEHIYTCNSTETANYSAYSVAKIVNVVSKLTDIMFMKTEDIVPVEQGSTNSTIVIVKNVGNATHYVAFSILGLNLDYYMINASNGTLNVSVPVSQNVSYLVTFSAPESLQAKDYSGQFKAETRDKRITHDFVMRVLPSQSLRRDIENKIVFYRVNMTKLWAEINESKDKGYNITRAEAKIVEAKALVDLAQSYIDAGNYFEANQLLDDIEVLIASAEVELNTALEEAHLAKKIPWSFVIVGIVVSVVVIFLLYLLWPQPGYDTRTGKYRHKTPKQKSVEKIQDAKDKLSQKFSSKPYRPYRYRGAPKPSEHIYIKPAQEMRLPKGVEPTDAVAKKPGEVPKPPSESKGMSEALAKIFRKFNPKKTETKT